MKGMVRTAAAAALAGAAAGWVLAGVFDSAVARVVGVLVPLVGAALGRLITTRWRENSIAPYLPLPAGVLAGFVAMWPDAGGPSLISEALRHGGISQPPVAFDPGWRFMLVALLVVVSAVSVLLGEARLTPLPGAALVLLGVLAQPPGGALVAVAGGLVLLAASLAVAVGGEDEGAGAFEARRLLRGGGALAGVVALLVVLSQFGFLFPDSEQRQVIPPKRPEVPPSVPDRVLFRVKSDRAVPLRLGVLDVYDGRGFLTPPYDSARFERLGSGPAATAEGGEGVVKVDVTVEDLGGHLLPGLASPRGVAVKGAKVEVDPRTDQLRLPKTRARKGLRYTVAGAPVPTAEALDSAPPPTGMGEFLDVPAPPPAVQELLASAPASSYSRIQHLRTALYSRVVAAGAGNAVDVPPERVAEMLDGKEASPYEITAAEVLLARWGGVPARLGYGYYDAQAAGAGDREIRPRNGATWLEAYFEGHGWVPVVGSPPRAKSSFNRAPKKDDPLVRPTDDLALVVYVPVRLTTVQLLYTYVRWWAVRVVPVLLLLALAWALVPAVWRLARRLRRRQWASGRGPGARLLVAYAEFRDAAADLNIGAPELTPIEFVSAVQPDDEHTQLAWLVTRGLWGDLRRDLTADDVRIGEDMAASVLRRLRRAQPSSVRLGALVSRTSLRAPWSTEVPNLAPPRVPRVRLRRPRWTRRPGSWRRGRARLAPTVLIAIALLPLLGTDARSQAERTAPRTEVGAAVAVPERVGDVRLQREPTVEEAYQQAGKTSIVARGLVWSVRRGDDLEGSLQVGTFAAGVNANDPDVRRAVVKSVGRGQFRLSRVGDLRAYTLQLPEQRFLLWFPPDGGSFHLLVTRASFEQADRLLVAVAKGADEGAAATSQGVPVPDPRRGAPQ